MQSPELEMNKEGKFPDTYTGTRASVEERRDRGGRVVHDTVDPNYVGTKGNRGPSWANNKTIPADESKFYADQPQDETIGEQVYQYGDPVDFFMNEVLKAEYDLLSEQYAKLAGRYKKVSKKNKNLKDAIREHRYDTYGNEAISGEVDLVLYQSINWPAYQPLDTE